MHNKEFSAYHVHAICTIFYFLDKNFFDKVLIAKDSHHHQKKMIYPYKFLGLK